MHIWRVKDLKEKAPLRAKFGLKDEWVLPYEVRPKTAATVQFQCIKSAPAPRPCLGRHQVC